MATKKSAVSQYLAEIGRRGGEAKTTKPKGLAALTPEDREAIRAKGLAKRLEAKKAPAKKAKAK